MLASAVGARLWQRVAVVGLHRHGGDVQLQQRILRVGQHHADVPKHRHLERLAAFLRW